MLVQPLDWEDPQEEGMATHSSILAWEIPWTERLARSAALRALQAGTGWSGRMRRV